jgi:16S rRNA (cytidine1402-2'-O)-methyltransferase
MDRDDNERTTAESVASRIGPRVMAEVERLLAIPLAPGLHLVATPIGNLGDITLRALAVLARADLIYCEDTRHSRTLLAHYGIGTPTRPYHEHNAEAERPRVLAALAAGRRVALISDAGTPLVSDPGYKLVRACLAEGHRVESVPGPSAVLAALSSSGLPTDTFLFAGFLPPRAAARRTRIAELAAVPATLVFFEAPSRVAATLADLSEGLGPERPAALARELTKLHEEVRRGTLGELAPPAIAREWKGEIVILVGPPQRAEATDEAIRERLAAALAELSLRDAAHAVAEAMGVPRSRVYDLGLRLRRERE